MNYHSIFYKREKFHSLQKTIVLYVFHEFNDRVEYFIKHGLFQSPHVDFLMICNHPTFPIQDKVPSYVKTINRENNGYDFGGWSHALLDHDYKDKYDTFIFVNSSVMGPFSDELWTNRFERGLNDDIQLFGVTINCCNIEGDLDPLRNAHIQSMVFSMKKPMLHLLIQDGIFTNEYPKSFQDCIRKQEIGMSRAVLKNGGNLGVTHSYYDGVDWLFRHTTPKDYKNPFLGDYMWQNKYNSGFLKLKELVFVKGNRIRI